jgi:hypothetical protein
MYMCTCPIRICTCGSATSTIRRHTVRRREPWERHTWKTGRRSSAHPPCYRSRWMSAARRGTEARVLAAGGFSLPDRTIADHGRRRPSRTQLDRGSFPEPPRGPGQGHAGAGPHPSVAYWENTARCLLESQGLVFVGLPRAFRGPRRQRRPSQHGQMPLFRFTMRAVDATQKADSLTVAQEGLRCRRRHEDQAFISIEKP